MEASGGAGRGVGRERGRVSESAPPQRLLRLDMHCHTRASFDCLSRPEDVLRTIRARGIDRLVVTDHNEIEGALRLREMDPVRILVGEEVKTRERVDIIGIFLTEVIPKGTPARETCEHIQAQGGVVYMPHPFDARRAGGGRLLEELADWIDVVEVHNARTSQRRNQQAARWARERDKPAGAGSDAHTLREIGRGYVEVPPFQPDRGSLLDALRAGRLAGDVVSSRFCSVWSTYAKVRKLLPGA
jgi:predicted metal-dependent phosphoesterase TrpH